jgi:hypothetical protein
MTKQDWVLLTVAYTPPGAPAPQGLDQLRLTKTLFLVQQRFRRLEGLDFRFQPYLYGPFTTEIYEATEALGQQGLLSWAPGSRVRRFVATPQGVAQANQLAATADATALAYLVEQRTWALRSSFPEIVRRIYAEFPAYKEYSVFRE